jgi:hypothetical protein
MEETFLLLHKIMMRNYYCNRRWRPTGSTNGDEVVSHTPRLPFKFRTIISVRG